MKHPLPRTPRFLAAALLSLGVALTACNKDNDVDSTTNIYGAGSGGEAGAAGASAGAGGLVGGNGGTAAGSGGTSPGSGGATDAGLGGEAGSDAAAGGAPDASADVIVGTCPALADPPMVPVPGGYCVDSTEVTRAQYEQWLPTGLSTSLPAACSNKTTHKPDCQWPPTAGTGTLPVVCVDWCDAFAYCEDQGKHLCGAVGGTANPFDQPTANGSEWYMACSSGKQRLYPYGDAFEPKTCNNAQAELSGCGSMGCVQPVGSMSGCSSDLPGYHGIFDLSGNVWEWENSCDSGSDYCRMRGGSFASVFPQELACAHDGKNLRGARLENIGFRCCADSQ